MLLAAHFQGHARALHAQTVEAIALWARNAIYTELLRENLTSNRALERNAQPNSIAEDFARSGSTSGTRLTRSAA